MGFLDNLENDLKTLEKGSEREDSGREQARRAAERKRALDAAPWVDRLKKSAFTEELLREAARQGFAARTKVQITWLGDVLRLEARDRRMELRPTPQGVDLYQSSNGGQPTRLRTILLDSSAADLVSEWLKAV